MKSRDFSAKNKTMIRLMSGKNLTQKESYDIFGLLFEKKLSMPEAKSLLLLLAKKGETVDEIVGCYKAIRRAEPEIKTGIPDLVDTCGTGGDGSHSFNISTVSAFVIAGAGGKVAKHGNRAISSRSGSSDLMRALGVKLNAPRNRMILSIKKFGIGYFHAPFYHPAFSAVQPLRKELGIRTIFNLLGPLLNPLKLCSQMLGVANRSYLTLYTQIFKRINSHDVLICHSRDGLDELTTSAKSDSVWVMKSGVRRMSVSPSKAGFEKSNKKDYRGGTAEQNALRAVAILKNRLKGPLRDVVVLNAAAGLMVSKKAQNLEQGIKAAELSLESGKAHAALKGLIRLSRL